MTQSADQKRPIAIGRRLIKFPEHLHTLGFRPDFCDYSDGEQALIRDAVKIYFPTAFYADLFNVMGKATFPSYHTFKFTLDKIRQTAIFKLQQIPHPRTRVFYGNTQKKIIPDFFQFPFIAKKARNSARGEAVFLIQDPHDLARYLEDKEPAYIQEYLPVKKDLRVVIIGKKIRLAFWRSAPAGSFLTNVSQGGNISFDAIPSKATDLALKTAALCGWDDVGIDIIQYQSSFFVLEANMKYGIKGFKAAGIDYKHLLARLISSGEI